MSKTLEPTDGIYYRAGLKGVLDREPWSMKMPTWFRFPPMHVSYNRRGVHLTKAVLGITPGFAWNFANAMPDFNWVKVASMAHDALLAYRAWLISQELLVEDSPADRALKEDIDTVFMLLCKERLPRWMRMTPRILFIGVNRLSRVVPGKDQEEEHKTQWVR